jgi:tetratricopeptide (TPR) repeat protein
MPAIFGGSKTKALQYYNKALELFDHQGPEAKKNNWNYLNLLVLAGQIQNELGEVEKAVDHFEEALRIESDFTWVKDELLPSLKND